MLNIDKGVPMPPPKRRSYPFRKMGIGDSFLISGVVSEDHYRTRASVASSAKNAGVGIEMRYADGNLRVWRVA